MKERKAGKTVVTVTLILLGSAALGVTLIIATLLVWSPGTVPPVRDKNGTVPPHSISEKIFVSINGIPQGMIIEGADTET